MNLKLIPLFILISCADLAVGQTITDPAHIEVYITPFYNSKGPAIDVGPFSSGLAAKNETEFVATIAKMKKSWDALNFAETYVAAIRLYDQGFRKEFTGFILPSIEDVFLPVSSIVKRWAA